MRTVRISLKTARRLLEVCELPDNLVSAVQLSAVGALKAAMSPKRSVVASRKRKDSKKKTKREETAEIRAAVMKRAAGGWCEAGRDECPPPSLELDHFFGRRGPQSERTCWALCWRCHKDKTSNFPSAGEWLRRFIDHCQKYGYHAEAERARARLHGVVAMRTKEASHGP